LGQHRSDALRLDQTSVGYEEAARSAAIWKLSAANGKMGECSDCAAELLRQGACRTAPVQTQRTETHAVLQAAVGVVRVVPGPEYRCVGTYAGHRVCGEQQAEPVAIDGKRVRGSAKGQSPGVHLLAAFSGNLHGVIG
jgi:hypothetical protein